ncbi:MAG TPA: branched-chain amino acid transaminase [Acidobacteriota bacterium]|nr:branched-chain amino acid transaminase [Acidobacteriota bacterium]HMZ80659.1 branched-chain amino acid transaminase [Acidobacteriota bacterium]HNB73878.1 branched-chain amino acid transaminase [Acidobacteriota bacterium]HNC44534.1 branched-chain amino acid transaminase [Acidobacteriota bacterium]
MALEGIAYFEGNFVPLADAKISVMTHAFNYGTGVFEGIRGYYNADHEEIYLFRLADHFIRLMQNAKIIKVEMPYTADQLCHIAIELVKRNGFSSDIYIRPLAYKNVCQIGTKLSPGADLTMFAVPMGDYVDTTRPLNVCVSSWRRVEDNAIPARGKICGSYVNSALTATEARDNGFDEAIVLNENGQVAEGSAMNFFIVRDGRLISPPVYSNILEGITRNTIMRLAQEQLGIETRFRPMDRSELYVADEAFFCGTGAQIAAIATIDHRPVGNGKIGPITEKLTKLYNKMVHGELPQYNHWLTPCFGHKASVVAG